MEETELKEGYLIDLHGDEQHESDCVQLHDEQWCHCDEAVMNESDGKWYHQDDDGLQWCNTNECYYDDEDMIYGDLYQGGEGWFHQDTDYEY